MAAPLDQGRSVLKVIGISGAIVDRLSFTCEIVFVCTNSRWSWCACWAVQVPLSRWSRGYTRTCASGPSHHFAVDFDTRHKQGHLADCDAFICSDGAVLYQPFSERVTRGGRSGARFESEGDQRSIAPGCVHVCEVCANSAGEWWQAEMVRETRGKVAVLALLRLSTFEGPIWFTSHLSHQCRPPWWSPGRRKEAQAAPRLESCRTGLFREQRTSPRQGL